MTSAQLLTAEGWLQHLIGVDHLDDYLADSGAMIRVVSTPNQSMHDQLARSLQTFAERGDLEYVGVAPRNCEKIQYPHKVVATIGEELPLRDLCRAWAIEVWSQLGYPTSVATVRDVAALHGGAVSELRQDFRKAAGRSLERQPGLSRDFRSALRQVIMDVTDGPHQEREAVGRLRSYLSGTMSARDLFQFGLQRKVSRETSTSTLRNLLLLPPLAGRRGSIIHLDFRLITDHELVPPSELMFRPTRQARIWVYQWVRELIDSCDRFSSTLLVVEFGPTFADPNVMGRGWGVYDALRLRLQDGVRVADGQNPSAPFISLGSR